MCILNVVGRVGMKRYVLFYIYNLPMVIRAIIMNRGAFLRVFSI